MSTIKDIEKMTGLSKGTISKFLNGGNVRPQNRTLIEEAVNALDYHPNETARIVRAGTRKAVAIVLPNVAVDYCLHIFLTCQQHLLKYGYGATLFNYMDAPESENRAVNKALDNKFDAIISVSTNPDNECYRRARRESVSILYIGKSYVPGAHNVIINDYSAAFEILTRLRECGHKRVGCILSPTDNHILTAEPYSSRCILEKSGLTPRDELMYLGKGSSLDIGYNGVKDLLSLDRPPTAIACLNGEILIGAKTALLESGLRIPDDISLVGMFTSSSAESPVFRTVTSVCYPLADAAETAVMIILKTIKARSSGKKTPLPEYISAEYDASVHWADSICTL